VLHALINKINQGCGASEAWPESRHGEIDQAFLPIYFVHDDLDLVAELEFSFALAADESGARPIQDIKIIFE
jgi:hypothetical protein